MLRELLALKMGIMGTVAARSGDVGRAREFVQQLLEDSNIWTKREPVSPNRDLEFHRNINARNILIELEDWIQLEQLARVFVWEFNPDNAGMGPQENVWSDLDLAAEADYVRALVMQGRYEEAMPWLEKTRDVFRRPYRFDWDQFTYPQWRRWETAEIYAEAMYQAGDYKGAVEEQEWALAKYEKHVAVGGKLLSRIATARCAWKLAELLEATGPEELDRRRELLDRAIELLDAPETEPRLLPEEREMRAEIEDDRAKLVEW